MRVFSKMMAANGAMLAMKSSALACPACFAASSPPTLFAFYLSTILLSAMPFAIVAGFLIYLRRHQLGAPSRDAIASRKEP